MRRRVRLLMVPPLWFWAFLATYAVVVGLRHLVISQIPDLPGERDQALAPIIRLFDVMTLTVAIFWCVVYGLYRVVACYPVWNASYWRWLASSPWRPPLPLPLGSILPVWQDALQAVFMVILAVGVSHAHPAVPLVAMLAGYLLVSIIGLIRTKQAVHVISILAILPGVLYAWPRLWLVLGVLAMACLVAVHGFSRSWRTFPWGLHESRSSPKPAAGLASSLGWPFDRLNACEPREVGNMSGVIAASLLVSWYLFSFLHCGDDPSSRDADATRAGICFFGCLAAFFRAVAYCVPCPPPLGIRARIKLGQWIIPGYDRALVAPLLTAVTAIVGSTLLQQLQIYPPLCVAIMAVVLLTMLLGLPPSLRNWQLTGQYRMLIGTRPRTTGR